MLQPHAIWPLIQPYLDKKYFYIAYSGGIDSHVLLHLLHRLFSEKLECTKKTSVFPKLTAIHINHALSPHAENWQIHCQRICADLQIPIKILAVDAQPRQGESPEAIARNARYQAFSSVLDDSSVILTAHHQDDQAETLLLQLIRGSGLKGLAAMPFTKPFANSALLRPLLSASREEITLYAQQYQLKWIDDESNLNSSFDRNFLRQKVIPLLKNRWPAVAKTLGRSAQHCAEAHVLLESHDQEMLSSTQCDDVFTLSLPYLRKLKIEEQKRVLRLWLLQIMKQEQPVTHLTPVIPSSIVIQKILDDVIAAQTDATPIFHWQGLVVRRYRDQLKIEKKLLCAQPNQPISWVVKEVPLLHLPDGLGLLQAFPETFVGNFHSLCHPNVNCERRGEENTKNAPQDDITSRIKIYLPETPVLEVRFRQGGEKIKLPGKNFHQSLKKLFQDYGVPPWLRERIPLLFHKEQLIAIMGHAVSGEYATNTDSSQPWHIIWHMKTIKNPML